MHSGKLIGIAIRDVPVVIRPLVGIDPTNVISYRYFFTIHRIDVYFQPCMVSTLSFLSDGKRIDKPLCDSSEIYIFIAGIASVMRTCQAPRAGGSV